MLWYWESGAGGEGGVKNCWKKEMENLKIMSLVYTNGTHLAEKIWVGGEIPVLRHRVCYLGSLGPLPVPLGSWCCVVLSVVW